jgi:hypothetical protein
MLHLRFFTLLRHIGNWIADLSPHFARHALALPRAFTRWFSTFFHRVWGDATIAFVFAVFFLVVAAVPPLLGLRQLILNPPANIEVMRNFEILYNRLATELARENNQGAIIWLIIFSILILILLPFLARLYVRVVAGTVKFIITWLVFVATGHRFGIFRGNVWTNTRPRPSVPAPVMVTPVAPIGRTIKSNSVAIQSGSVPHEVRAGTSSEPTTNFEAGPGPTENNIPGAKSEGLATMGSPDSSPEKTRWSKASELELVQKEMKTRVDALLTDLRRREETNLGIGMLLSAFGVILLAFLVFSGTQNWGEDKTTFLLWFMPRLSIVAFIQIFAYCFLRLYRANLSDIKYFNNELTNIEYKRMAIGMALENGTREDSLISQVCLELLKVERNFIIRKGETTVYAQEDSEKHFSRDEPDKQVIGAIRKQLEELTKKINGGLT